MKQNDFWQRARKVLINKYAITLYVFAVLFVFIGDQSLLNQISRSLEIRETRKKIEHVEQETVAAERVLRSLENKDSLERFARETYRMHADDEVVYIVE